MDYAKSSETIADILKSAAPQGGSTARYSELEAADSARDGLVSQLKASYEQETTNKVDAKEFSNVQKTYKNMIYTAEGDLDTVYSSKRNIKQDIGVKKETLMQNQQTRDILQVLVAALTATFIVYFVMGDFEYVHIVAFAVLSAGFGYAIYLKVR
jgi:hypothetical protein